MKKYYMIFAASFLICLTLIGGSYYFVHKYKSQMEDPAFKQAIEQDPSLKPPDAKSETVINTLVMGIDDARSDIMVVVRFNKETNKLAMISIPRDTRVQIPGYNTAKINSAVAHKEGAALAMETVGNLLDIPIHHYVKVDFKGAEKIIDTIGGVKVYVPLHMVYNDPAQDLYINISKGEQVLNGENAVKFVRFRAGYPDQDLGRIKAQHEFIKAFAEKMTSPKILPKLPDVLDAMTNCVKTNMEQSDILNYALKAKDFKMDDLKLYTLPGKAGTINHASYYLYNEEDLKVMMTEMNGLLGIESSEKAETSETTAPSNTPELLLQSLQKSDLKIMILNSTGKQGLAGVLKKNLEEKGYTHISTSSLSSLPYNFSRIINRQKEPEMVRQLALDCEIQIIEQDYSGSIEAAKNAAKLAGAVLVEGRLDSTPEYDITIVIGKDKLSGGI